MPDPGSSQTFHPVLTPRRVEVMTWLLAAFLFAGWWLLQTYRSPFAGASVTLFAFTLFAAFGITLSGWMDRRSVIRLDEAGVFFENGLRRVELAWNQIEQIRVLNGPSGSKRVQVVGPRVFFEFRTLAVFRMLGQERGRTGYEDGERILGLLLEKSGLAETDSSNAYVYYSRGS